MDLLQALSMKCNPTTGDAVVMHGACGHLCVALVAHHGVVFWCFYFVIFGLFFDGDHFELVLLFVVCPMFSLTCGIAILSFTAGTSFFKLICQRFVAHGAGLCDWICFT